MTEENDTRGVKRLNILVVEDNMANRLLAFIVLGNMGHYVFYAHNE